MRGGLDRTALPVDWGRTPLAVERSAVEVRMEALPPVECGCE